MVAVRRTGSGRLRSDNMSSSTPASAGGAGNSTVPATATDQVHAGYSPGVAQNTTIPPIYQSASYQFDNFEAAREIFALRKTGNLYSRTGTPTNVVLEQRVSTLDGGVGALSTASGQSAVAVALLALVRTGQHIVASNRLYGGTVDLLGDTFADFGITTTFVDPRDVDAWRAATTPETRAWFVETVDNPTGSIPDLHSLSSAAHDLDVPFVVDNTVATPVLLRAKEFGADVIVYSATKFLGGHGAALGGIIVDAGTFDFEASPERWLHLTTPSARFGGITFTRDLPAGVSPYLAYAKAKLAHDLGPTLAAHSAFLLLQGIETLSLRVARQTETSLVIATALAANPKVARVHFAGLPTHPDYELMRSQLGAAPSVFSFDLAASDDEVGPFIDRLRLFSLAANIGDARSLVMHPATTTHSRYTPAQLETAGISWTTVRLSIGLEDPGDLLADLEQALSAVTEGESK